MIFNRDCILGRHYTPIHCLCDTYLAVFIPILGGTAVAVTGFSRRSTGTPPSSWDKLSPDKHHMFSASSP